MQIVASFTDAWIETYGKIVELSEIGVASFTDAWIETLSPLLILYAYLSHLLQMRGLKLKRNKRRVHRIGVASFTDAWIETD